MTALRDYRALVASAAPLLAATCAGDATSRELRAPGVICLEKRAGCAVEVTMLESIRTQLPRLRALCEEHGVRRLALFGSARRDDFDATSSDIDFVVEFTPMGAAEHRRAYFGLLDALETLFARPVDLLEPSTIENPYLRQGIAETQETLYVAA